MTQKESTKAFRILNSEKAEEVISVTSFKNGVAEIEGTVTLSVMSFIRTMANLFKSSEFISDLNKAYQDDNPLLEIKTKLNGTQISICKCESESEVYADWRQKRIESYAVICGKK